MCMWSLYCCLVACVHLWNGTGRRTMKMAASLLLASGLVRYEAVLHSCGTRPVGEGVPTCDSAHLRQLYSVASLGHQATGTMTFYPSQSQYPDTEPTSPYPILIMLNTGLGSINFQVIGFT